MRGKPDGFLSSAGRCATGLLSFRYTVRIFLVVTRSNAGWHQRQSRGRDKPGRQAMLVRWTRPRT